MYARGMGKLLSQSAESGTGAGKGKKPNGVRYCASFNNFTEQNQKEKMRGGVQYGDWECGSATR